MKVTIEVDCTPEEARTFLGLPDVAPLNAHLVSEMRRHLDANLSLQDPEALVRSWMAFGGQAQEQFRAMMTAAVSGAREAAPPKA